MTVNRFAWGTCDTNDRGITNEREDERPRNEMEGQTVAAFDADNLHGRYRSEKESATNG